MSTDSHIHQAGARAAAGVRSEDVTPYGAAAPLSYVPTAEEIRRSIALLDLIVARAQRADGDLAVLRRVIPRLARQARALLAGEAFPRHDLEDLAVRS